MKDSIKKAIYIGLFSISILNALLIYMTKGKSMSFNVGWGLIAMYVLMAAAFILAILLAVKSLVLNAKSGKMVLIGIAILLVLVGIGYVVDDKEILDGWKNFNVTTSSMSGLIGGSLIATWIILFGAVGLTLFASIFDFIKRL